jgi:hypothetical protein
MGMIVPLEGTESRQSALRHLLTNDVWPHAGRSSFVDLFLQKHVPTPEVVVEKAVGLRLTFRHPPPSDCLSNQSVLSEFKVAGSAYDAWSHLTTEAPGLFPPDRFHFQVLDLRQ